MGRPPSALARGPHRTSSVNHSGMCMVKYHRLCRQQSHRLSLEARIDGIKGLERNENAYDVSICGSGSQDLRRWGIEPTAEESRPGPRDRRVQMIIFCLWHLPCIETPKHSGQRSGSLGTCLSCNRSANPGDEACRCQIRSRYEIVCIRRERGTSKAERDRQRVCDTYTDAQEYTHASHPTETDRQTETEIHRSRLARHRVRNASATRAAPHQATPHGTSGLRGSLAT